MGLSWYGMCVEYFLLLGFDVFEDDGTSGSINEFSLADDGTKWFLAVCAENSQLNYSFEGQ